MARTITRSYDDIADAETAVSRLEAAGVQSEDISIIGYRPEQVEEDAKHGGEVGGVVGGGAGLLGSLAALPIPGVGPAFAAGWILSSMAVGATAGVAAGNLIGAMSSTGLDDNEAHYFAETIRRGGVVVSVRTSDSHAFVIEKIMDGAGSVDAEARRQEYEREGWKRFDESAGPYRTPHDLSGVVS
ncbi:hypothetical protein [Bosea vaviloviae]|uniref:General stress protein 17M-like domain-containing protein n=1 Tax=Bosea vaviloviae TaxID=1526658 RepID=A0A1D7U2H8_9HYPH|nr:hypothetical protein [Bosea vaviloviae]AOO81575.1 hypothetical protein BHK69_14915 [Bosea vaviloviae]